MSDDLIDVDPILPELTDEACVFRTRDVHKIYVTGEVQVHALRSIDLDVPAGQLMVMLGASGSGKSTLLNILGGLDVPTGGRVLFRGTDLSTADERTRTRYRRERVGFVFQFYNLIPSLTARENVALVTDIATSPMMPEEALRRAGLPDRMDHFPSQLSGGEQQRVAIARAIAKRPDVLLCDEPRLRHREARAGRAGARERGTGRDGHHHHAQRRHRRHGGPRDPPVQRPHRGGVGQ
jgi:putative ABC transport system ATP-binding protein